ncbi:retrovirus-related pol polyprotein from transposon TNT 1-94 [Tanacetum coccineum]
MFKILKPIYIRSLENSHHEMANHLNLITQGWQRSQQAVKRNRGKAIVNSPPPTYDQEPTMVTEDNEMSKENKIDKLMALISLSFKKIYRPTNNNLRTSSNTSRANQENTPRINKGTRYDNQRVVNVAGARENVAYHKEKMLLSKQKEAGFQLNVEQADWKDDTDDEPEDQELEAHYMYMAQIQEVTPDAADNSGPIFDAEPLQKVQHDNDNYNVFYNDKEHPKQPKSVNDTYLEEQGDTNITIDSLDMSTNREMVDQDDDDLAKERDLLASLIEKLKCKIDESKNRNKFLESSNKTLVDKLKDSLAKKDFSKSKSVTKNDVLKDFSKSITAQILLQNVKSILKNTNLIAPGIYRVHTKHNQTRTPQLPQDIRKTNKHVSFSTKVIPTTSVSRPRLKSNQLEDRVMSNNSQRKKQEVKDHQIILFIVDSGCSKNMIGNLKLLSNFVEKFLVAFQKSTSYIHDLKGNDLLTGSRGSNLYSITLQETFTPNLICLMAKASSSQAWLWLRHVSHLMFDTINLILKYDIVTGLLKLKFIKDHLYSSYELGKAKHMSFKTKTTPSSKRWLQIIHMDLCGPMRVESFNGMEFLNKTLHAYFAQEGIEQQTSTARTPKQNDVVERRNCILVEAARTMLSAAKGILLSQELIEYITRVIVETIHINFDELPQMVSDRVSSNPVPECPTTALEHDNLSPGPKSQENVPQAAETVTTSNELDLLFSLMFDELLSGTTLVVSKCRIPNSHKHV